MSVAQFVELVKSQVQDFGPLQVSFLGFFFTCALESLVTRKRLFPKPPRELVTDMFYFLFMPTVRITSRILGALIVFRLWSLFGAQDPARLMNGFGPVSRQPTVADRDRTRGSDGPLHLLDASHVSHVAVPVALSRVASQRQVPALDDDRAASIRSTR